MTDAARPHPSDDAAIPLWVRRAILLWWGILVSLWLALFVVRELRGLLIQLVLSLFISFALEPLVDRLERRGMKRGAATGVSLFAVLVAALGFVAVMGQLLATQLADLVDELPSYIVSAQGWLETNFDVQIDADQLIERVQSGELTSYANDLSRTLLSVGSSIASGLFQMLTILLFSYYLTADGPRLRRLVCSVLPPARQTEVLRVLELATNKTGAYISSRVILAVISAVFHWLVFTLLDLPSAFALALWVGVISQFIPTLGTYLAGILPALVAIGVEPTKALWVIGAVVVYQQIENYILQPRITAQTLDMHPAVSIGAVLAGTSLFGAAGALLALPVVATGSGFVSAYIERHPVVGEETEHDGPAGDGAAGDGTAADGTAAVLGNDFDEDRGSDRGRGEGPAEHPPFDGGSIEA